MTSVGSNGINSRYKIALQRASRLIACTSSSEVSFLIGTDLMREWIFRNTPRASCEQATLCDIEPYPYKALEILRELRETQSGYWCAGHASLLVCAYRDLGLRAATIAFGIEGGYTHAITAVKIGRSWFLQDPYSNIRFGLEKQKSSSFSEIWCNIHEGQQVYSNISRNRLQPYVFCDVDSLDQNTVLPLGWHSWKNTKKIGLLHVSAAQFFQHPFWPRTEPQMLKTRDQDPLTALFCAPLWLSDPEHGYFAIPQEHPLWNEMTTENK